MSRAILALTILVASQVLYQPIAAGKSAQVWTDADVVRQSHKWSCGAAAVASLLTREFGDAITEKAVLIELLRSTSLEEVRARQGISLLMIKKYLVARGYNVTGYTGLTWNDIRSLAPLLVPVKVGGGLHYVIVLGVNKTTVRVADPAAGLRQLPLSLFEEIWSPRTGMAVS